MLEDDTDILNLAHKALIGQLFLQPAETPDPCASPNGMRRFEGLEPGYSFIQSMQL